MSLEFGASQSEEIPQSVLARWNAPELIEGLVDAYKKLEYITDTIGVGVRTLIEQKNILVLACGSPRSTYEDFSDINFEAHLPRLLSGYNPNAIFGVDIFPGDPDDNDVYTHIQTDLIPYLRNKRMKSLFPFGDFDLIFSWNFLSSSPSPTLLYKLGYPKYDYFNSVDKAEKTVQTLSNNLLSQLPSLLTNGGIASIEKDIYMKQGRKMKIQGRFD